MVRDVISALTWDGDPTFRKPRNVGHPARGTSYSYPGVVSLRATIAILPLHWPAPSIVVRSRRTRGATRLAILPREGRRLQGRGTDGIRAADVGRSANQNLHIPTTHQRFEAG